MPRPGRALAPARRRVAPWPPSRRRVAPWPPPRPCPGAPTPGSGGPTRGARGRRRRAAPRTTGARICRMRNRSGRARSRRASGAGRRVRVGTPKSPAFLRRHPKKPGGTGGSQVAPLVEQRKSNGGTGGTPPLFQERERVIEEPCHRTPGGAAERGDGRNPKRRATSATSKTPGEMRCHHGTPPGATCATTPITSRPGASGRGRA